MTLCLPLKEQIITLNVVPVIETPSDETPTSDKTQSAGPSVSNENPTSGHERKYKIREVLMRTLEGKAILASLDGERCISLKQRRAIQRILVSHLVECFGEYPTSDVKTSLAVSIVEEFPCLKDHIGNGYEAWFCKGRNKRPSTGFLEECLRNRRKRALRQTNPHQAQGQQGAGSKRPCLVLHDSDITEERAMQMVAWLKVHVLPLDTVTEYMRDTAIYRAKWIQEHGTRTVAEIQTEFPRLVDTPGMIAQDFHSLHPEASAKLAEKWVSLLSEKILKLAAKERNAVIHLSAMNYNDDTDTADMKGDVALQILPYLLPGSSYKVAKNSTRPTLDEAKTFFIDKKPVGTNMPEYLREAGKTRPEPFVLLLGQDSAFSQVFFVFNGEAQEQRTLLAAVDVCFKSFYVYDINYPKQCSPTWEFLQTTVYELPGAESSAVRFLRTTISAL
ncbi:uncharacterized protein LOC125904754 [Epinephelus fuscoguttatus]|uniref:uncharacterized protein LOC125904754 n=1 Tax=Epinephelus fuscoguttatus TaxID=293821 RepID=UPI0020D0B839|nr:uncharacterized protein LOC125904754 [Epinephelus fuscoguttatus]